MKDFQLFELQNKHYVNGGTVDFYSIIFQNTKKTYKILDSDITSIYNVIIT